MRTAKITDLLFIRDAGAVTRNHTARVRPQRLSEHVAGVCEIILAVRPDAPGQLLKWALRHDVYEKITGDTPATAKWLSDDLSSALNAMEAKLDATWGLLPPDLPHDQQLLLKWADMAEFVFFCLEELTSGNQWARSGLGKGWKALRGYQLSEADQSAAHYIMVYLQQEYQQWTA